MRGSRYLNFLQMLHARKLLTWTLEPQEKVGVFFVKKSDGRRLRMIVDARRANRHMRASPAVHLATSESFGNFARS